MESKYNNFYAHLERFESEELNSDLDNFQSLLNQRDQEGFYDVYCLQDQQKENNRHNARVCEIPTVYLVTRRKTEHLPEFQYWTKQNKLLEGKCRNMGNSNRNGLVNSQQESKWKVFASTSENFKFPRKCFQIKNDQNYQHRKKGFVFKDGQKIFGSQSEQIGWKTDLMIYRGQKYENKNENRENRNSLNFWQIKQKEQNYVYGDSNCSNDALNVYRKIMDIVEQDCSVNYFKMEEERSQKSFVSRSSCNSFSIKSGNLRMINERMCEINKDQRKMQQTRNYTKQVNAKRKRIQDFQEQWDKRKYCQESLILCDKRREGYFIGRKEMGLMKGKQIEGLNEMSECNNLGNI